MVVSAAASSTASTAPAPLPATAVGKPSTEMALALEDANAQLGQVTEMNHRLKLRLQAPDRRGGDPQGPVAGSNRPAKRGGGTQGQSDASRGGAGAQTELADGAALFAAQSRHDHPAAGTPGACPGHALAGARARRELEEQEKSLSESTSMVMGDENSEFEQLMTVGIADDEPSMACRISTSRK